MIIIMSRFLKLSSGLWDLSFIQALGKVILKRRVLSEHKRASLPCKTVFSLFFFPKVWLIVLLLVGSRNGTFCVGTRFKVKKNGREPWFCFFKLIYLFVYLFWWFNWFLKHIFRFLLLPWWLWDSDKYWLNVKKEADVVVLQRLRSKWIACLLYPDLLSFRFFPFHSKLHQKTPKNCENSTSHDNTQSRTLSYLRDKDVTADRSESACEEGARVLHMEPLKHFSPR